MANRSNRQVRSHYETDFLEKQSQDSELALIPNKKKKTTKLKRKRGKRKSISLSVSITLDEFNTEPSIAISKPFHAFIFLVFPIYGL